MTLFAWSYFSRNLLLWLVFCHFPFRCNFDGTSLFGCNFDVIPPLDWKFKVILLWLFFWCHLGYHTDFNRPVICLSDCSFDNICLSDCSFDNICLSDYSSDTINTTAQSIQLHIFPFEGRKRKKTYTIKFDGSLYIYQIGRNCNNCWSNPCLINAEHVMEMHWKCDTIALIVDHKAIFADPTQIDAPL